MVKDQTTPSQNASTIAADQTAKPTPALQGNDTAVEANKSAANVAADKTVLPPPALQGNNDAVLNSESKDSETSSSQPPPETGEVSMVDELKDFNDLFDFDQTQQTVAAKAAKTIVDVSTDPTDTQALPQEQKDTSSVIECNSFLQILEERVCKTIHKDFRESGQVCTSKAASDIL